MAKGKKTGGRDFQIGKGPGPGRPTLPPEVKEFRRLTKKSVEEVVTLLLQTNKDELKEIATGNNSESNLKLWFASVIQKGINSGDYGPLNSILDRLVGKVKEKVEHSGDAYNPVYFAQGLSEEEVVRRAENIMNRLKTRTAKK